MPHRAAEAFTVNIIAHADHEDANVRDETCFAVGKVIGFLKWKLYMSDIWHYFAN